MPPNEAMIFAGKLTDVHHKVDVIDASRTDGQEKRNDYIITKISGNLNLMS